MRVSHKAFLAANQGIRGGPEKTLGKSFSRRFADRNPIDLSSGDMPLCLGGEHFPTLDAVFSRFDPATMAYDHNEYRKAQDAVARYLGGNSAPDRFLRSQVVAGISSIMQPLIRNIAYALGYDENAPGSPPPYFVLCPPIHPNWLSAIVAEFGYGVIRTIRRGADGYPNSEDAARVFRSLDRPFVVISTPDENPAGVCTPNSRYFNRDHSGILNLIRDVPAYGFWVWDAIYQDFSWGSHANQRPALRDAARELGIRTVILHSLSKIYMKPGLRIGGMYYLGPLDEYGSELCNLMQVEANNRIKNGISGPSLPVLQLAYSGDAPVEEEKRVVLAHARRHVEENQRLLLGAGLPHVFPEVTIDTAMYGFHRIAQPGGRSPGKIPWHDPIYREWLVKLVTNRLGNSEPEPDPAEVAIWDNFLRFKGAYGGNGFSASRALAIELAMNGVMALPHDPFYPRFASDQFVPFLDTPRMGEQEALVLRFILAYSTKTIGSAMEVLARVWNEAIDSYTSNTWRSRYR